MKMPCKVCSGEGGTERGMWVPCSGCEGSGSVERLRLVVVESPFAHHKGDTAREAHTMRYLRAALADCLARGEAPFASHAIYTQEGVLDDWIPAEREKGIAAGFAWAAKADARVVYTDLGISKGMALGIKHAHVRRQEVEMRTLPGWADEP